MRAERSEAQLLSGALFSFFGEGFPFKVNPKKRMPLFSYGHWASEEITWPECNGNASYARRPALRVPTLGDTL